MSEVYKLPEKELDEFLKGYLVCALWSSNDESREDGGDPLDSNYDIDDVDSTSVARLRQECLDFMVANRHDLRKYTRMVGKRHANDGWQYAGHDFWLTRNHHGAGYWDRGVGEVGERLTQAAHLAGGQDIYVGDDKKLYIAGFEVSHAGD